jgi:hypothetical protein
MHHYQPESKRPSVQWKHSSSPSTKFKVTPSAGKVMNSVLGFSGTTVSPFSDAW